jgi:excinuclease ABC subunit A
VEQVRFLNKIIIKGARQHNLKNIDLELPRDRLIVFTGLSGSGKSSLAFDTIYAEGQRRYVESLSSYARQFLGQMDKPDVDQIEGLSPAISIDQKTTNRNPRSTVGTVTEVYDYMRLMYARIGVPHCPECGKVIARQTVDQVVDQLMELPEATKLVLLAPLIRGRKGEHKKIITDLMARGYTRVRVDGEMQEISEDIELDRHRKHTIEAVVDRIVIKEGIASRLADSLETAFALGDGLALALPDSGAEMLFSQDLACPDCNFALEELTPRMFSFNSPYGACPVCDGLGVKKEVDLNLVVPDPSKPLLEAVVALNRSPDSWFSQAMASVAKHYNVDPQTPFEQVPKKTQQVILYGSGSEAIEMRYVGEDGRVWQNRRPFEGVIPRLVRFYKDSTSEHVREEVDHYMNEVPCPTCQGQRLKPEVLAVTVGGLSISATTQMSVRDALTFYQQLILGQRDQAIARDILKEIIERLGFLVAVGLDYLTLERMAGSLSGGESQRIRLATQIGSALVGVLYVLDEPSIGLHQRDNAMLLKTLLHLRDLGNTLIVVEHDEDTVRAADFIVDIGPGAGKHGGEVVAYGGLQNVIDEPRSITGAYFSGRQGIPLPDKRRQPEKWLKILGATENNLKNIDVDIPLGCFTAVTGVSGSGKSSLINEILHKKLAQALHGARKRPGQHRSIKGMIHVDKVIDIDQSPIGRTPRSNPATYTGVFDSIRELFSLTAEAKVRGYKPGRFSFNVRGGRCEACSGDGIIKIEMHFLPDVYVPCEVCKGKRYNRETLEVQYKGRNIAEVLDMTVEEAWGFFQNIPKIERKLRTLSEVGLGYIHLGQSATTLSGGEAQRVKLATELSRRSTGKTLYILDEPTTGLHMDDISRLLLMLQRLVENGDSVVVIEHNLDVIKTADYVIDLGPEGGDRGGEVLVTGTPEEVAAFAGSYTGTYLAKVLRQ